ncbi:hypothetical protein [uncultured Phocaeicola sp.]|uniref:hypothetical protein n=1 Tax=uncultured Phocaeicola sp. TaxID=990718 RepID=UPI0030C77228
MEEKKLTERESLELISQMIRSTRENMEVGSGNQFLAWGYFSALLSVLLFVLVTSTGNNVWALGWFAMFAFWGILKFVQRGRRTPVVTYTDRVVIQVWQVIGALFILTVLVIIALTFVYGRGDFSLMLPLALLYCGIGTSITGIVIKETWATYSPLVAFVFAIYMLASYAIGEAHVLHWYLYFGLSFVFMMIVPGHIINRKAKQICSKN